MVFLRYRWMGHDYWGYWCNDCTLYFYKRIHFIINYEICKTKYPTAHHICRHFRDTYCLLFILRQHTIPDSERNNIIWLHRTTRDYYFFCTYIARAISIFSVIRRFCVIVMVLILSQKPDEGKQKLKLVHAKRKIYNERIEFTMPVPQNYKNQEEFQQNHSF